MDEAQFETFLTAAYRAPSGRAEQPGLAGEVLARADRRRRSRRAALALATLVGVGFTGGAVWATGAADLMIGALARLGPEPALIDPSICLGVGFFLMLLAAARNEIREL